MRLKLSLLALSALVHLNAQESTFKIPPSKILLPVGNQEIVITVSGAVAQARDTFHLALAADLAEFQKSIAALLAAELNRSDECGERLMVQNAVLIPQPPASLLTVNVHYERWACIKALGRRTEKRLVGGNGVMDVKLTPSVHEKNELRLVSEVGKIEADGSLGELLRSGSVGDSIREKIKAKVTSAIQKATDLNRSLPPEVERVTTLRDARFGDAGSGRLSFELKGDVTIGASELESVMGKRKGG